MNNNQNNNNNAGAYTEPCVSKPSAILPILLTTVFLSAATITPFPFGLILMIFGAAFTAKAFSVKFSFFPFLTLIPPLALGFFIGFDAVILPFAAFICGFIMYFILKHKGNKTACVIGVSTFIVLSLVAALLVYTYKNYNGISMDDFSDLVDDLGKSFAAYINTMLSESWEQIQQLPDSSQKTQLEELYKNAASAYSNTDLLLNLFLYVLPGVAIGISNIISYIGVCIYFSMVKQGTGHEVSTTPLGANLILSPAGVTIYGISFFILCLSMFFSMVPKIVALNFVIIYLPGLIINGLKSLFIPEIRKRNKLLIGAALFTLFFNPIFTLILVGFLGANTVLTQSMMKFVNKHYYDQNK